MKEFPIMHCQMGPMDFLRPVCLDKEAYGMVYKCTLRDQGTKVAVKVFNTKQSRTTGSFVAECEALRRVRHRCLIKIITCCSSISHQGEEFKALVFEFMPNGNMKGWLHHEPESRFQTVFYFIFNPFLFNILIIIVSKNILHPFGRASGADATK